MHQWNNLTIYYCNKQIDVSFSQVCPVIDNEFYHNMKFMTNNRSDAWNTDNNLLNWLGEGLTEETNKHWRKW